MDKQAQPYPDMPEEKITRLAVAHFNREIERYCVGALRAHGCIVSIASDRYDVFFPDGTTQKEILPRVMNGRYTLLFPDGFVIESVYSRYTDLFSLKLPVTVLPHQLQEKYRESW